MIAADLCMSSIPDAALDRGLLVDVLFLDVSKAFDTVDHSLLVRKLSSLDVAPQGCEWMESYLEHRTQSTLVGNSVLDPLTVPPVCRRALSWVPCFLTVCK